MESSDLSIRLNVEQTAPVSEAPAVQGKSLAKNDEGRQRRRPLPPKEAAAEPAPEDGDRPQHRIDSLA